MMRLILMLVICAQVLPAQESKPSFDDPKKLVPDAVTYEPLPGPTRKRNVMDIETLFDGEHLKPYEVPYDINDPATPYIFKQNALLGSWSVEGRASWLRSISGDGPDIDGFGLFGRARFGNFGVDLSHTGFDEGRNLDSILAANWLIDLDIYQWLVMRAKIGYTNVELETGEDDGFCFGAEVELYPVKPFSLEIHHMQYAPGAFGGIADSFIGVGFFPTMFANPSDSYYPQWVPEIRLGWRRIVGNASTTNSNFLALELAIEF